MYFTELVTLDVSSVVFKPAHIFKLVNLICSTTYEADDDYERKLVFDYKNMFFIQSLTQT